MCKIKIRREFIHLKFRYSYSKCKKIIKQKFDYDVSIETLKRWLKRFKKEDNWTFEDKSTRPNKIHYKVNLEIENKVLYLRKKTNYGCEKLYFILKDKINISQRTINRILKKHNLTRKEHNRQGRKKYIKYERKHPNTAWHIDDTFFNHKKVVGIIDDMSRFVIGLKEFSKLTTLNVVNYLDILISKYGKPRQIISDNGNVYGLRSRTSKFDKWCKKRDIKHIRIKPSYPQSNGKIERLFGTLKSSKFKDLEEFVYDYNCQRPHNSLNNKTPNEVYSNLINWF